MGLGLPFLLIAVISGGAVQVHTGNITDSIKILFGSLLLVVILLLITKWKLGIKMGMFLFLVYIGYLVWEILRL